MSLKRKLAAVLAGVGIAPFLVVVSAGTASAHGYISSPPSRQAMCAQGRISNCGPIVYEPQSVEGPKGQRNCHAGVSQFAQLNDDSRPWPTTAVGNNVTFNWTLTARHATSTWEYFVGGTKIAEFNDGGRQPAATVTHNVSLGGRTGRIKLLAIWNIADTPMAFYSCVDLQVGTGGGTPTSTTTPPPTSTTQPPTSTTQPPVGGTWAPNVAYSVGSQVTYGGVGYRCIQAHTSLVGWEPPNTAALWQRI
ncbi:lytic polysaccharide monooxygenase [Saccharothrix hoggarensis]|uniref:Lytic polysaccharide monooxygenase n=1 Tax=Saccharothrix hoggarensis TaxID=913853 RepID=A0ABW3QQQ5_9PSEU